MPGPTWHPKPTWHQPLHGKRVPRQGGAKTPGSTTQGDRTALANIVSSALANRRMPLTDTGHLTPDNTTNCRTWGTMLRALDHDIEPDQATWLNQGSVTISARGWLNSLNPKKLLRVAGPYFLYSTPYGMDGPCPGAQDWGPPMWTPMPPRFFPAATPAARTPPRDLPQHNTGSQRSTPDGREDPQPSHSPAPGPSHGDGAATNRTNKPQHPLAGRGAREPWPSDPNAPGRDRALLHLTIKPTAQLPTALEGETHFIVEGITDNNITLATNTLAAVTDTWDDAVRHTTARKDRIKEKEDTLMPQLMHQLLQLRSLTGP